MISVNKIILLSITEASLQSASVASSKSLRFVSKILNNKFSSAESQQNLSKNRFSSYLSYQMGTYFSLFSSIRQNNVLLTTVSIK